MNRAVRHRRVRAAPVPAGSPDESRQRRNRRVKTVVTDFASLHPDYERVGAAAIGAAWHGGKAWRSTDHLARGAWGSVP